MALLVFLLDYKESEAGGSLDMYFFKIQNLIFQILQVNED